MSYMEDFLGRIYQPPISAQAGYRYTTPAFNVLHATSAVQTDEDALAYIKRVEGWFPHSKVMLVEKREAGAQEWKVIHRDEEQIRQLHVLSDEPVHVQRPVEVPAAIQDEAPAETARPGPAGVVVSVPPIGRPAGSD